MKPVTDSWVGKDPLMNSFSDHNFSQGSRRNMKSEHTIEKYMENTEYVTPSLHVYGFERL